MNFRNNKGFTGIDISVSVIIILILIPTIFGIVYNMQKTRVKTERQAEAVDIATNVLETVKNTEYEEVTGSTYSYEGKNKVHYNVAIEVQKMPNENVEDLLKKVKVTVTYPIGNETKSIDISTLIQNK